ncbi:tRNA (guanosine(46)-N7)-methyltransferase TrmB [uncultured Merdimonas sp.]|uniref:tRNA (guanosine(46)-N7)-methyltransferase TrmB n=1 Tax=uncultured Merdimonas sp. TaxID=2023269 RepID=UPI0032089D0D
MRLRNIPRAGEVLSECKEVVKNYKDQKNAWNTVFGNDHPIHIEIGMGKGQFLLSLAAHNPQINYIGVERYSSVLLRAVEKFQLLREEPAGQPSNLRFLCMDARELPEVFGPGEVEKIYLNFSDPWPKARHARRRLTSEAFLSLYARILPAGGTIEFKTDNRSLFDFSVEEVSRSSLFTLTGQTFDLHRDPQMSRDNIMTEYEEKFSAAGNPICKLTARRDL